MQEKMALSCSQGGCCTPVSGPPPYKKGIRHSVLLSGLFCKLDAQNSTKRSEKS